MVRGWRVSGNVSVTSVTVFEGNAHAGVRLTHPVLYSVGVYTDTPTTCMPSDQNNCRLATYTLHVMHHAQFTLRVLTEGLQL